LEELIAFGRGRGRGQGRSFQAGAGVDVETQTDWERMREVGDLWSGGVFGDGQNVCDDDLESVVMLQRAAAATFVMDELKKSEGSAAAGRVGVEMTLPDSPRCARFDDDNHNGYGAAFVIRNWECLHYDGNYFGAATGTLQSSIIMMMHMASVHHKFVCL
jgi:hypothetical protein